MMMKVIRSAGLLPRLRLVLFVSGTRTNRTRVLDEEQEQIHTPGLDRQTTLTPLQGLCRGAGRPVPSRGLDRFCFHPDLKPVLGPLQPDLLLSCSEPHAKLFISPQLPENVNMTSADLYLPPPPPTGGRVSVSKISHGPLIHLVCLYVSGTWHKTHNFTHFSLKDVLF